MCVKYHMDIKLMLHFAATMIMYCGNEVNLYQLNNLMWNVEVVELKINRTDK